MISDENMDFKITSDPQNEAVESYSNNSFELQGNIFTCVSNTNDEVKNLAEFLANVDSMDFDFDPFGLDFEPSSTHTKRTISQNEVSGPSMNSPDIMKWIFKDLPKQPKIEPISPPIAGIPGAGKSKWKAPKIKDSLDKVIYKLIPMDILRLDRNTFNDWKKKNLRKLTQPEKERLAVIRRKVLACVYAERARSANESKKKSMHQKYEALVEENKMLKDRIAQLEEQQRCPHCHA